MHVQWIYCVTLSAILFIFQLLSQPLGASRYALGRDIENLFALRPTEMP